MFGLIYKASSPSGKVYIGQTTQSFLCRQAEHVRHCQRKKDDKFFHQNKFYKALRKHGSDFKWEVLYDNVPISLLSSFEVMLIEAYDSFNNGYNSTIGGDYSPMKDPIIALKVANSLTGKKLSKDHREKCAKNWLPGGPCNWLGRKRDDAFKEKLRLARLKDNPAHKAEVRKKMSESAKKRWERNKIKNG